MLLAACASEPPSLTSVDVNDPSAAQEDGTYDITGDVKFVAGESEVEQVEVRIDERAVPQEQISLQNLGRDQFLFRIDGWSFPPDVKAANVFVKVVDVEGLESDEGSDSIVLLDRP